MSGKHSAAHAEGQGSHAQCWRAKLFSKRSWATSKPAELTPAELTENEHIGEHASSDDGREPQRGPHTHVGAATTSDRGKPKSVAASTVLGERHGESSGCRHDPRTQRGGGPAPGYPSSPSQHNFQVLGQGTEYGYPGGDV